MFELSRYTVRHNNIPKLQPKQCQAAGSEGQARSEGCLVFDLGKNVGVAAIDNGWGLGGPKVLSLRLLFQFADNCSCVCI